MPCANPAQAQACTPEPKRVAALVAWGGFGKSALARQWLWLKENIGWPGGIKPDGAFWRTFGQAADIEAFMLEAIAYFGDRTPEPRQYKTDAEKPNALRKAINGRRFALVLDGLEPAQRGERGEEFGRAQIPLLAMLLKDLAAGRFGPGMALVTSRLKLADLEDHPNRLEIPLEERPFSDAEVRLPLTGKEGVEQVTDVELSDIVNTLGRHPLALKTLATLLHFHNGGKASGREQFVLSDLAKTPAGHTPAEKNLWKVLSRYDDHLAPDELRLIRVLAHFREPVEADWLKPLFTDAAGAQSLLCTDSPASEATNAAQSKLCAPSWTVLDLHAALDQLKDWRLLEYQDKTHRYSLHPPVGEHFRALSDDAPHIHAALYRLYAETLQPEPRPATEEGLHPLYEAVYHGCRAGWPQRAYDEVFIARIRRSNESYSVNKLGLFAADLDAVRQFFDQPWRQTNPELRPHDQAWLYSEAAFDLRALGRLPEALAPMRASLEMAVKQEDWQGAAISASNLGQTELAVGQIAAAVKDVRQSVDYADRSGEAFERMAFRTALADALHQQGQAAEALRLFQEAETLQRQMQPDYPPLYSLQGFQYVDLLLADSEQAAWAKFLREPAVRPEILPGLNEIRRRVERTLDWVEAAKQDILSSALYRRLLSERADDTARRELDAAVDGLRKAGQMDDLPRALVARAWLRQADGRPAEANADLDEAQTIAENGGMKLHLADIFLTRARLFQDRAALQNAKTLIEETGYARRRPELEVAAQALGRRERSGVRRRRPTGLESFA